MNHYLHLFYEVDYLCSGFMEGRKIWHSMYQYECRGTIMDGTVLFAKSLHPICHV